MTAVSHVGLAVGIVDHPRSVVDGCCYVLKFRLDRIHSFGGSAIFRFSRFFLGFAYSRPLLGGLGVFPQNDVTY